MDQHSFLFQAMVYLAAAVLLVPLSKKLGLGSVLGYLFAGVIIGPSFLGFVGSEGEDIMHFAEFGVVMMLFLIGLELEPEKLWRSRGAIIGLGGLQVIVTSLVFAAILLLAGIEWKTSVALGMIISLSSTAIVLQTLSEKGISKTTGGINSFSVLLFQDIAVIPMLAFFPLMAANPDANPNHLQGSSFVTDLPAWAHALIVAACIICIILAGRFFIRPFFRFIAGTRLPEMFTAAALLLVVGTAVLMTQVGMSPALGTFLAGVVLANSEYRHELESDIEPFKGLLLGLFFLAVGASINFNFLMQDPWTIIGFVLLIMSIKGFILFVLARFARMNLDQNLIFSFALCQVGEFAFVLLSFSMHAGIIDKQQSDTMMAVVAISMALTPLLMMVHEKFLKPRLIKRSSVTLQFADNFEEKNPVIIAGFGHFGNIVGRFLKAHNIPVTILDTDSQRVDLLRRMGFKVYYGDASRQDVLRAAGADVAKIIVIAIEPSQKRLEMIETIKKNFPDLRMYVRANNRKDAYGLMNAGMMNVYRETLDTSLRLGVDIMKMMGHKEYSALKAAKKFFKHDEENLKTLASIRDPEEYITTARSYMEELEAMLRADMEQNNGTKSQKPNFADLLWSK